MEGERLRFLVLRIFASDMSASSLLFESCSSSTYTPTDIHRSPQCVCKYIFSTLTSLSLPLILTHTPLLLYPHISLVCTHTHLFSTLASLSLPLILKSLGIFQSLKFSLLLRHLFPHLIQLRLPVRGTGVSALVYLLYDEKINKKN